MALTCSVADILRGSDCNVRGGGIALYVGRASQIDLAATTADFTETTKILTDITMTSTNVFHKIQADLVTLNYVSTFEDATGLYTSVIQANIIGISADSVAKTDAMKNCCDLVLTFVDNAGAQRVQGLDYLTAASGLTATQYGDSRITKIEDASGDSTLPQKMLKIEFTAKTKQPLLFFTGTVPV